MLTVIADLERRGVRFAVATVVETVGSVPGKLGSRLVLTADGREIGTVGGAAVEQRVKELLRTALADGRGGLHRFELASQKPGGLDSVCGGSTSIYIEMIMPRPHLVLLGGGHVALAVARLCDVLEYRYTVVDARPEFASPERFPGAVETVVGEASTFFADHDLTPYSHLYLMAHSHHEDERALAPALERFSGPIGLIGSQKKRIDLKGRLAARGIDQAVFDERVHCPIGIPIGAETPAEIAVSVLAEVIRDYRRAKDA